MLQQQLKESHAMMEQQHARISAQDLELKQLRQSSAELEESQEKESELVRLRAEVRTLQADLLQSARESHAMEARYKDLTVILRRMGRET